jgi:hypothetical protein
MFCAVRGDVHVSFAIEPGVADTSWVYLQLDDSPQDDSPQDYSIRYKCSVLDRLQKGYRSRMIEPGSWRVQHGQGLIGRQ